MQPRCSARVCLSLQASTAAECVSHNSLLPAVLQLRGLGGVKLAAGCPGYMHRSQASSVWSLQAAILALKPAQRAWSFHFAQSMG